MLPKSREARARRAAHRQGLTLKKSGRRDPRSLDYGRYWLFKGKTAVRGGRSGVSLPAIEEHLGCPVSSDG